MRRIPHAIYVALLAAMSAGGETPSFENDYGRADIGKPWESMMAGQGLAGWQASEAPFSPSVWRREGDAIIADTGQASRGLTTNPTMLVVLYGALTEGRIVKPESLSRMLEGGWRDPVSPGRHYGFGLFVYDGGASFGHGGLWPGYRTHVTHYASSGTTIAVQTNRDGRLDMQSLVRRIAREE